MSDLKDSSAGHAPDDDFYDELANLFLDGLVGDDPAAANPQRDAVLEEMALEDALFPWLADDSMADHNCE